MSKLVNDLVVNSTEAKVSEAVGMGGHNAAMFEVWMKAVSGTLSTSSGEGLIVTLQGSNDKLNWENAHAGTVTAANTGSTAPEYFTNTEVDVIPYGFIRLHFKLVAGTSPVVLVDASIRSFTTSS
jgi:hypothetical protein